MAGQVYLERVMSDFCGRDLATGRSQNWITRLQLQDHDRSNSHQSSRAVASRLNPDLPRAILVGSILARSLSPATC